MGRTATKTKVQKVKEKPTNPGVVEKPKHENIVRYSDDELEEFKELITGKLEIARAELQNYQEQLSGSGKLGDHSDSKPKGLDDGASTSEREYLNMMASRQIQHVKHLENALMRIENGTYGICRITKKLIPKDRLRAVPHATLSIEAKELQK